MDVIAERSDIDKAVSGKTIPTIFADAERRWGDRPALRWKNNGDWETLTWHGYREQVAAVTLALRELGFGPDQFALIMARNVPEHMIADLGIVHAGGAAISVYNTLAPEQIEYVANHSGATVAFVENEAFLAKILAIRSSTPALRHLVLIHGEPPEGVLSWDDLVASGREAYARDPSAFERSWRGSRQGSRRKRTRRSAGWPAEHWRLHSRRTCCGATAGPCRMRSPRWPSVPSPCLFSCDRRSGSTAAIPPSPARRHAALRCMSSGPRSGCRCTRSGA